MTRETYTFHIKAGWWPSEFMFIGTSYQLGVDKVFFKVGMGRKRTSYTSRDSPASSHSFGGPEGQVQVGH